MRITEVRDGFIKIESEQKLQLSSFLLISDEEKKYIAQVINSKRSGENDIVYSKILFNYDAGLVNYDKSLPSLNSSISVFDFSNISNTFNALHPITIGQLLDNNESINVEKKLFENHTLISVDDSDMQNVILTNLSKQFADSIVIDMIGNVSAERKFVAGVDFKLPLNTDSLAFMYEDCLNDATGDSKNLIKEIFKDLSDYSKTVPFLPFMTLKTIIDDMVDKSHVFKLLVLKNKLDKFNKLGYFANNLKEVNCIESILNTSNVVIDLSKLDVIFQNRYLSVIYSYLKTLSKQVFIVASNSISKNSLKTVLTDEKVFSIFLTHSKFKYLNEIKSFFENFIIEPNFNNSQIFKAYSTFISGMSKNSYLILGKATNYLPLVSDLVLLENTDELNSYKDTKDVEEQISVQDEDSIYSEAIVKNDLDIEDLEQELENESENVVETEVDETIDVIEKKSEVLIDKVSEEIINTSVPSQMDIFESDDVEEEEEDLNNLENSIETETQIITDNDDEFLQEDLLINEQDELIPEIVDELPETVNDEIIDEIAIDDSTEVESDIPMDIESISEDEVVEELEESMLSEDIEELEEFDNSEQTITTEEEYHTVVDEFQTIEVSEEISIMTEDAQEIEDETVSDYEPIEEVEANILEQEFSTPTLVENNSLDLNNVNDDLEELESQDLDGELIELDADDELPEDTILVDLEDDNVDDLDVEKEIIEDVDKVFTTMKDDDISDSDLDFIDELNNEVEEEEIVLAEGMEELTELRDLDENEEILDEPIQELNLDEPQEKEILETKNTSTPMVPVYDADIPQEDLVSSDPIEQGDTVSHAKYGTGVVEKMIKYGSKSLYSINFDNVGRRLLDPTLTEIKKV